MAIVQSKYVSITSGIGGQSAASRKDLILRLFTTNELFPVNTILEFAGQSMASDVANYCGSDSTEAKLTQAYAGWVSKQMNQPAKISFMRYNLASAVAPTLRSTKTLSSLATFTAVTNGSMIINMGGVAYTISSVDLSSATAYSDIASALKTKINANTSGGALFTAANVTYDSTTESFILTGGSTGNVQITYASAASTGTDLSSIIGWNQASNPVVSNGAAATNLTDTLNNTVELSDNFATYAFIGLDLTDDYVEEIGAWNTAQNYRFMFVGDVDDDNYSEVIAAAAKYQGMAINYNPFIGLSNYLPAYLMPASIFAATDYDSLNGTVNYMYQQFPSQAVAVSTNTLANTLDPLHINYNGQTQKAGTPITFYQDGYLADGTDIAVYANEIWLKDAMITEILNLEVAVDKIPANIDGLGLIQGVLADVIKQAKDNGTILAGKTLTTTQKAYITQLTGDNTAWQTVELNGYVLQLKIDTELINGATKYIAKYMLVYSKGDVISKVEGRHILI